MKANPLIYKIEKRIKPLTAKEKKIVRESVKSWNNNFFINFMQLSFDIATLLNIETDLIFGIFSEAGLR